MIECAVCGKETDKPMEFEEEKLCWDCYAEKRKYYCGCRCSCW